MVERKAKKEVNIKSNRNNGDGVTKNYEAEVYRDGMEAGAKAILNKLVKKGIITKKQAKNAIGEK